MKIFKKPYRIKLPKSRHEVEELGKGKKGLIICEQCNIFYYKKSWHHSADSFIAERENKDLPVNFALCPACKMIKNRQYEGIMTIKNVPVKFEVELVNFIKGYCRRAYSRDPLDRLIKIKKSGNNLIVTVTENELANKLGKKIKNLFNKVKTKTVFLGKPSDVARVDVEFLP